MAAPGGNDAHLEAVVRVPAGETVRHGNALAGVEVVLGALLVDLEGVIVDHRAIPDTRNSGAPGPGIRPGPSVVMLFRGTLPFSVRTCIAGITSGP